MSYPVVDGCPVPQGLILEITALKLQVPGARLQSCYRGRDAEPELHAHGKHSQWEIAHATPDQRRAWGILGTPNPAGQSTHELRSDGVAYRGPVGRKLDDWQCGMDWDDPDIELLVSAAKARGWVVIRPYAAGAEHHHLNFERAPGSPRFLRIGDTGPWVWLQTHRLAVCGYLPHSGLRFNRHVQEQVQVFQARHRLVVDGTLGPQTQTNLAAAARACRVSGKKEI